MINMTRVAVNFPDELLNEFDEVLKENGYHSRSKGLQDALDEYIQRHKK